MYIEMSYFTLKLIHIYLIISWFAGLFYLPRIFVNLAALEPNSSEYKQLCEMARRLYRFMAPIGYLALVFGILLVFNTFQWTGSGNYWTHGKVLMGVLLMIYQLTCKYYLRQFQNKTNTKSHKFFRYFNELPVFVLLLSLYIVLFKPF